MLAALKGIKEKVPFLMYKFPFWNINEIRSQYGSPGYRSGPNPGHRVGRDGGELRTWIKKPSILCSFQIVEILLQKGKHAMKYFYIYIA